MLWGRYCGFDGNSLRAERLSLWYSASTVYVSVNRTKLARNAMVFDLQRLEFLYIVHLTVSELAPHCFRPQLSPQPRPGRLAALIMFSV